MKKQSCLSLLCATALAAIPAVAGEAAPAEQPKAETVPAEVLKKTTHGRSMLAREENDPEAGRFTRALSACIRYYTGSNK